MKYLVLFSFLFQVQLAFAAEVVSSEYEWGGLFLSGDDSISNFDRGRVDLGSLVEEYGLSESGQMHFTVDKDFANDGFARLALFENLNEGFETFQTEASMEACFVHMTSHGIKGQGFYLADTTGATGGFVISPKDLGYVVNKNCGKKPTVILVSACYSGQFINDALKGDNRVIMTAARSDLPSFGCSEDTLYTYWDACLLDSFPSSDTWAELSGNVNRCIDQKEAAAGAPASYPQAYFGKNVKNMRIFNK